MYKLEVTVTGRALRGMATPSISTGPRSMLACERHFQDCEVAELRKRYDTVHRLHGLDS